MLQSLPPVIDSVCIISFFLIYDLKLSLISAKSVRGRWLASVSAKCLAWDTCPVCAHLIIIPRARIGSESIAHEAEGRMGYWLRGREGERNNCFSKIKLVGQKNIDTKHLLLVKARLLPPKHYKYGRHFSLLVGYKHYKYGRHFSLLVGYNISPSSSSTNQNAALIIDH